MQGLLVILIFAVMLVLNVPVAISLGVASFAYLFFMSPLPVDIVVQSFVSGVDSFTLLAVPFFILAGDVMREGGISKRLTVLPCLHGQEDWCSWHGNRIRKHDFLRPSPAPASHCSLYRRHYDSRHDQRAV